MRELVINVGVRSCCGLPATECSCDTWQPLSSPYSLQWQPIEDRRQPLDNASFFATCDRDEKGRCTSGGGGGWFGGKPKAKNDFNPSTHKASDRMIHTAQVTLSNLTPEERETLVDYTDEGFEDLNKSMRECPPEFGCVSAEHKEKIATLESVLNNALPIDPPTIVYRGVFLDDPSQVAAMEAELSGIQSSGGSFMMPSFTSTTLRPEIAKGMGGSSGVTFKIAASKGLYVEGVSANPGEHELLKSPRDRYRVVGMKRENNLLQVDLEEVL